VAEAANATGPDLSEGVGLSEVPVGSTIAGRVGDDPVLLSNIGGEFFAIGGTCTHYGGALAEGVIGQTTVRCPLHHACFDLRTGEARRAPALDPVDRWRVEVEGDRAFVRGHVTMLSADTDPPCDRPNLSKDYLAGTAQEEWLWLRSDDWYAENRVEVRLSTEVTRIDAAERLVHCASGEPLPFDRLLIATGAEPNRLPAPGFDRPNVHMLRSVADARSIADAAKEGSRAVIIGASFIALEVAASLRHRSVHVEIVSVEEVPLEHVFGREMGKKLQALHESNGVRFHLNAVVESFDGKAVVLGGGARIDADFVVVGIGVRPRIAVAQSAGAAVDKGVLVDAFLETSVPGIFAAGDIASYPEPISGQQARIEHWVVAERQGEVAAANMLGQRKAFESAPFFWTEQYGVPIRYVGRASGWDAVTCEGDFEGGSFAARYFVDGIHCATATIGRDRENLEDELRLEATEG
jgi:NADPH-dependent 2,4-dienoyl-CoA reductase/sulfur reductase-like enzyme